MDRPTPRYSDLDKAIDIIKVAGLRGNTTVDDATAQLIALHYPEDKLTLITWILLEDCRSRKLPVNFVNVKRLIYKR